MSKSAIQSKPTDEETNKKINKKKLAKEEQKNIFKSLVPVFKLKMADLGNRSQCKFAEYVNEGDKIYDEPIESKDDKRKETYGSYDVEYITTQCKIAGTYMIKNDKLPLLCKSVTYSKKFISGNLFSVYLYFTLDDDTRKVLTDPSKYLNRMMSGEYTLELLTIDSDFLANFLKYKKKSLEHEIMNTMFESFEQANDDEKETIMTNIGQKIDEILSGYTKFFEPHKIERPRKNKIIAEMDELFNRPEMAEFIRFGLDFRDKKRIEESCPDQTFEKPKKIINIKELKNDIDNIDANLDKLLENCSESDYSENSDD